MLGIVKFNESKAGEEEEKERVNNLTVLPVISGYYYKILLKPACKPIIRRERHIPLLST